MATKLTLQFSKMKKFIISAFLYLVTTLAYSQIPGVTNFSGLPAGDHPAASTLDSSFLAVQSYIDAQTVTLPTASTSQLYGGTGAALTARAITLGSNLSMSGSTLNASSLNSGYFNVQNYGAVGDNVTDDTTAIQAALTAAAASTIVENSTRINKGASVYFPAGVYVVSSQLTVPARVKIYGDGPGGVLSSRDSSAGASVIRGTFNGTIINAPNDRFTLSNIGVFGPFVSGDTSSVCIKVGPTNANQYTLEHIWVEGCYDGLIVDGAGIAALNDVSAQFNYRSGIRALGAQGPWSNINVLQNGGDGLYVGTATVHTTSASPWITNLQSFGNGGYGVNVQNNGININGFFLNNDYNGELYVGASAEPVQISGGELQYAGVTPAYGTNTSAPGIYIASGYANAFAASNIQTFNNEGIGIDIESTLTGNSKVVLNNIQFAGDGQGGVSGNTLSLKSSQQEAAFSNLVIDQGASISGNYTQLSNSWVAANSSTIPALNITGGVYLALSGLNIYQNGSGNSITTAGGTSYTISSTQAFGTTSLGGTTLTSLGGGGGGGSGTVTSVSGSGGSTGLTLSGGPITTSGTLTLGGTLAVANGGTGTSSSTGYGSVVLSTSPVITNETINGGSGTASQMASTGPQAVLTLSNSYAGSGAAMELLGDGSNPNKYIRSTGGYLQVLNSAASSAIFLLNDSGNPFFPGMPSSTAAQSGTVCYTSSNGALSYDPSLGCLSSTIRVKEHVKNLDIGLPQVLAMRPVTYDLKPEFNPAHLGHQVGLIAEELDKVDDRLVGRDSNGVIEGVRYAQLTAVLVKSIQEMQIEIDSLKKEIGNKK